ncbi:hypothetical protein N0V90_007396 [Kalmusia sp. IMI 367209]|nr:hypothetical protein N0V90_007396 [Kalmusia sp. IMI 367209]
MADRFYRQPVPDHWNAYRPTYSPDAQQRDQRSYPPRNTPLQGDHWVPDRKPATHQDNPRFHHGASRTQRKPSSFAQSVDTQVRDNPDLPRLWDREIDQLAGRTLRAYNLVVNYQTACPNGHRWTPEHIGMIRETGKDLENERRALDDWREHAARFDISSDIVTMDRIQSDAARLRDYCLEVQHMINSLEQHIAIYKYPVEVDGDGQPVGIQIRGAAAAAESMTGVHQEEGNEYGSKVQVDEVTAQVVQLGDIETTHPTDWTPFPLRGRRFAW